VWCGVVWYITGERFQLLLLTRSVIDSFHCCGYPFKFQVANKPRGYKFLYLYIQNMLPVLSISAEIKCLA
jgi:hypothetical protein